MHKKYYTDFNAQRAVNPTTPNSCLQKLSTTRPHETHIHTTFIKSQHSPSHIPKFTQHSNIYCLQNFHPYTTTKLAPTQQSPSHIHSSRSPSHSTHLHPPNIHLHNTHIHTTLARKLSPKTTTQNSHTHSTHEVTFIQHSPSRAHSTHLQASHNNKNAVTTPPPPVHRIITKYR